MLEKISPCWLVLASLFILSAPVNASEPGEQISHPQYSVNGCPLDHEWTAEVVTNALGLQPRMLERLSNRFAITKEKLCTAPWEQVEGFVRQANNPKHRTDEPDGAAAFRASQRRDETGKIKPTGLIDAISQRAALLPLPTSKPNALQPSSAGIAGNSWTWLGPGNIGGRVRAISPHPTNANELLVGSVSGGIWRTTNGGAAWAPINDFLPNVAISCLVRDPANANIIYACTGEGYLNQDAVSGFGIYKSTDNGSTWMPLASTNPPTEGGFWYYVYRLAISPTNSQIMIAATDGGAYRTTDGGTTWTQTYGTIAGTSSTRRVLSVEFHPTNSNIVILGEGNHYNGTSLDGAAVAYSADGGQTWVRTLLNTTPIVPNSPNSSSGRVEIAIAKSNPLIVYALVDMSSGQLYRSTNGGATWTPNAPLASNTALTNVLSAQGWYDNAIWVAPNDQSRIIVGGVGLRMSVDGGTTWAAIGGTSIHADHHVIVADPNYASNSIIYGGNDGGVYKGTGANTGTPSASSPSWTSLNNGLGITQFYGGAGTPGGRITGGTQDNGSLYWVGTTNWVSFFGADGGDSAADPVDGNYIYGETQRGGVTRYTAALSGAANGGEFICAGILDASCNFSVGAAVKILFIPPMRLDPNNANSLLIGADRLWKSSNIKATPASAVAWTAIKPSLLVADNYISAIAVASGNSNIIWVGYKFGDVACTTNGGISWTAVTGTPGRFVTRITIDPANNNRVFIANGGYSANNANFTANGCSAAPGFTSIHNQLPAVPIRALTIHPTQSNWLYAGTEVGLFTSENGGATWSTTNDGPGTVSVEEIFFFDPTTVTVATHGRGMYQASALGSGPGMVQISAATQTVLETAGSVTVTVNRTGANLGAVTVNYATANGTAIGGVDYTAQSGTFMWANGESGARSFVVPILLDATGEPTKTFTVGLSAPTGGVVLGAPTTQTINIVDLDSEAFPKRCQMPAGWTIPASANSGWSVVTNDAVEGACTLKSNAIVDSQKAQIQFTGMFNAGVVTFTRKVSSELGWDCLRFLVDGVQQTVAGTCASIGGIGASGSLVWGVVSVPISAGQHTLLWSYEKDASEFAGTDAAWIDAVVLPLVKPAVTDLSGDGKSDLIWQHLDGTTAASIRNGLLESSGGYLGFSTSGLTAKHIADYNGDGRADILWELADGSTYMALMNGATNLGGAFLQGPGSPWRVSHVADFNGDGKMDLVWKHSDGTVAVSIRDGLLETSGGYLAFSNSGLTLKHTGDFNGDGKADILWQLTDGSTYMAIMNGAANTGGAFLTGSGSTLRVHKVADFNDDGKADILWELADGSTYIALMNGATNTGGAFLTGPNSPLRVKFVTDFNGDGKADILWELTDGSTYLAIMNGITNTGGAFLTSPGSTLRVRRVGDFNGDGKADIIWDTGDGATYMALMDGTVQTSGGFLSTSGSAWRVMP